MTNERCWILLGGVKENLWYGRRAKMTHGEPCSVDFNADYVIKREETKNDVIGWLHTHPGMVASPSGRDHRTMKAWVCALGHPLVCAIAGVDGLRAYWYMDDESDPIEGAACVKLANFIVGVTNTADFNVEELTEEEFSREMSLEDALTECRKWEILE